ncbi:hypothetical protein BKA61DRAFT_623017 [Leptodontidium sp. MPI-SDFR-AT-0119]|nr:hypothetical protein BKA61DRAFT_623017 [Leptodontidium sp. MPI-SDFR-AT-0119]
MRELAQQKVSYCSLSTRASFPWALLSCAPLLLPLVQCYPERLDTIQRKEYSLASAFFTRHSHVFDAYHPPNPFPTDLRLSSSSRRELLDTSYMERSGRRMQIGLADISSRYCPVFY